MLGTTGLQLEFRDKGLLQRQNLGFHSILQGQVRWSLLFQWEYLGKTNLKWDCLSLYFPVYISTEVIAAGSGRSWSHGMCSQEAEGAVCKFFFTFSYRFSPGPNPFSWTTIVRVCLYKSVYLLCRIPHRPRKRHL